MFVAKVTGSLVSTQKVESMKGYKLLIVEPYRVDPEKRKSLVTTGRTIVAGLPKSTPILHRENMRNAGRNLVSAMCGEEQLRACCGDAFDCPEQGAA